MSEPKSKIGIPPHSSQTRIFSTTELHGHQGGAVVLLSLAGILIVLLIAMMTYDAGIVTKDKTRVQSAADFSALSQASIKARSMNMLAYSNIAKRSIWAIHSTYPAHVHAYRRWIFNGLNDNCEPGGLGWSEPDACASQTSPSASCRRCQRFVDNKRVYKWETAQGHGADEFYYFSGEDYGGTALGDIIMRTDGDIDVHSPSTSVDYFAHDLRALDNYQRYLVGATPWWAWLEHLLTGIRNGASIAGSYPPPPGGIDPGLLDFGGLSLLANAPLNVYVPGVDTLPVKPWESGSGQSMADNIETHLEPITKSGIVNMLLGNGASLDPFLLEHLVNNVLLISASSGIYGDSCLYFPNGNPTCNALWSNVANTPGVELLYKGIVEDFLDVGLDFSKNSFSMNMPREVSEPWQMQRYLNRSQWLTASSNIVFTYLHDHGGVRGSAGRGKYDFLGDGPMESGDFFEQSSNILADYRQRKMYSAVGYWGMARSEITFSGHDLDEPDLWHPSWTAKLRPVSLPGEFADQQFQMSQVYNVILPYMRLAQQMMMTSFTGVQSPLHHWDFARMQWMMRSMSESTVEGVTK